MYRALHRKCKGSMMKRSETYRYTPLSAHLSALNKTEISSRKYPDHSFTVSLYLYIYSEPWTAVSEDSRSALSRVTTQNSWMWACVWKQNSRSWTCVCSVNVTQSWKWKRALICLICTISHNPSVVIGSRSAG